MSLNKFYSIDYQPNKIYFTKSKSADKILINEL